MTTQPQYALAPDLQLALLSVSGLGGSIAERGELRARRATAALSAALGAVAGTVALYDAVLLLTL